MQIERTVGATQAERTLQTTIGVIDTILANPSHVNRSELMRMGRNVLGTAAVLTGTSDNNAPLNDALNAVERLTKGDADRPDAFLGAYMNAAGMFMVMRKAFAAAPTTRFYDLPAGGQQVLRGVREILTGAIADLHPAPPAP